MTERRDQSDVADTREHGVVPGKELACREDVLIPPGWLAQPARKSSQSMVREKKDGREPGW